MTKLKLSLMIASATLASGLGSAVLFNGVVHGEWDLPGLNQQVQHVTEVTTNHEGRITNLEGQVNTPAGQATPTPVVITKVVTEAAPASTPSTALASVATPAPVWVPSSTKVVQYVETFTQGCDNIRIHSGWMVWFEDQHTEQASVQPTSGNRIYDTASHFVVCNPPIVP